MKLELSTKLKNLLKERDLTVAQLSRATHVPAQTINNWLSGLEPRSMNQVKRIADYFEISIDELAYGDNKSKDINAIEKYSDEIFAGIFEVVLRRKK